MPRSGVPPLLNRAQSFDYLTYIDQICKAINSAWSTWRDTAALMNVAINNVMAQGGQLVGPSWQPLIMAGGPLQNPEALKLTQNIAACLGNAWYRFSSSLSVPGLPWYPKFAAVSAPMAPPEPNLPSPLSALMMDSMPMNKFILKGALTAGDTGSSKDTQNLYEALAEALDQAFQLWKDTTLVTNVMGTGPVPSFAPPQVPVGPVIGGMGNMLPGGFV